MLQGVRYIIWTMKIGVSSLFCLSHQALCWYLIAGLCWGTQGAGHWEQVSSGAKAVSPSQAVTTEQNYCARAATKVLLLPCF